MKITRITTHAINMPMKIGADQPHVGGQARTALEMLLVRVETDEGVIGWGEGFGHRIWAATKAAIDTIIAPACIGRDPREINALMAELTRTLHSAGRHGATTYGLSAIDIALWDIAGKLAGLPVYRLLGGGSRADLPAYASLLRYGKLPAVERQIDEALERGYKLIKIHEIDPEIIRGGRRRAGDGIPLMVDCNCPWSIEQALAMCAKLRDLDLEWLEEPVWPPEPALLAQVRREGGIPVAAGENVANAFDFQRLFAQNALTVAQPSVTKVGGVSEMRKVFDVAATWGVRVVPHSAYFGPGLLASIHVSAAQPKEVWIERFYCEFDLTPLGAAIDPVQGRIAVPQGPGLGIDPDPDALKRLAISN
ncbi:MAG: mandelate racemase/muconate lactonizing enzyme family protein [Burkholderiales bacterium]